MIKQARRVAVHLTSVEVWVIALLVAATFFSTRILPWAVGVAGLFWGIRWLANERAGIRTPLDWGIIVLLLMIPVTLWASAIPDKTSTQVYRTLTGIALYYSIVNWAVTSARLRLLVIGAVLAGLFLALISLISVEWPTSGKLTFIPASLYDRFVLLVSDTANPNVMAGNLVLFLPFALGLLLFGWGQLRWFEYILAVLALLAMGIVLFMTQSRGALMALAVVLVLIMPLRWRRWGWLLSLAIVIAGVIALQSLGVSMTLDILIASDTLASLEGRLEVWSRALYMIQDFPFTGVGMGLYGEMADLLYPFFIHSPGTVEHAHNLFLQVAVDLGIPGLIAWGAILMVVIATVWQVYRHGCSTNDGWAAGLGAGLLCSQVALVVHGLVDAVTWGMVRPAPIVWAIWGLAIAGFNVHAHPQLCRTRLPG